MPVEEGFVTVNIDGQDVRLLLETAQFDLTVIDGDWYEEKYGKGSCKADRAGCYVCPPKDPCNFDTDPSRKTTVLDDDRTIESIRRTATLVLDNKEAANFTIQVSRPISWNKTVAPCGFLGLSGLPPSSERFHPSLDQESVLDALVRRNVIGRQSYTIRTDTRQTSQFISGELTLGDTLDESKRTKYMFPEWVSDSKYHRAFPAVSLSSMELFYGDGRQSERKKGLKLRKSRSFVMTLATGANGIYLPYRSTLDNIEKKMKRRLEEKKGYTKEKIDQMWLKGEDGFAHVKSRAFGSLPVLGLELGDANNSIPIKIHPRHYCGNTEQGDVIVFVRHYGGYLIGTPFFRAYSVHVDYTNNKIALLEN
ncbi:hypothetical protein FOZ63_008474 [Perkinsus olseni]|uniref:Uncharacterized protein n=1 Tax=Perkinsus olseni TaxID=32597 RepID=A0A7J6UB72_PEROL|nr:hypothetical protein FOZ60_003395 [Perkinsus olseni]KAF4742923.1 hypothetical protein FOZ62_025053 [Perkinsus olseni]KAF4754431.1 hypothetical protein FOZ63_008474 [Perkinsus olseni]